MAFCLPSPTCACHARGLMLCTSLTWMLALLLRSRYKEGGVAAFYRGLAASVLLCINPAIYNTVFDQLKARVLARAQARAGPHKVVALSTVQAFVLGVIAKAIATLLTYPYIRAKMVMQASSRAQRAKAEESEAGEAERKGTDDTSSSGGVDLSQAVSGSRG